MISTKMNQGTMKQTELNVTLELHQFMTMVSLDNNEKEMLRLAKQFCYQSKSSLDQRLALELFYINKMDQELQHFIEKNKESEHTLNQKYALLYQLMFDISQNKSIHKIRKCAQAIRCDHPELRCLRYFLYIELDVCVYQYDRIGYYLGKIQQLLPRIENPLLVTFYNIRIHSQLFMYYWKRNELILARKHAYEVLHTPYHLRAKAQIHIYMALSYIYEDFYSSIYHIEEAKEIAQSLNDNQTLKNISTYTKPFICAHFGEVDNVETVDPVEQAHIEIAKGNRKKAIQLLESIVNPSPFTQYYLGLATKKQHFFIHSYQSFMEKRSDHFFARLPLNATQMVGL
ncbi:AimR family lysis-lysogeny pheromone receptor [Gracilibacillus sp. YIM 98692]|uniref:AimR family lysis-lysogeny pheromone receptor n=1 Tax=Gracilibacillus sp. YIM 98692 TaxID=2663532 RepID=UPI0013D354A6|nr:AimR family lysis-lysogeny pheromone receptor [Gracilibacillus sp. YIM 98692]